MSRRGIEFDCLIELIVGAVELLLPHIHEAATGESAGRCGIELDRSRA
jgi:hypothetical protein